MMLHQKSCIIYFKFFCEDSLVRMSYLKETIQCKRTELIPKGFMGGHGFSICGLEVLQNNNSSITCKKQHICI